MKGKVAKCDHREYGFAQLQVGKGESVDKLFEGLAEEMQVCFFLWSHKMEIYEERDLDRSGCPMVINSRSFLPTSMS